ncbi:hypothetical protein M0805_001959 [Coniferiporia weirii]|nr:hypothetical protein M0805_001959 [Coniferiporia weirii]
MLTCAPRAYLALHETIRKFKKIENRIRTVEGGVQLMDALVGLRDAVKDGYLWNMADQEEIEILVSLSRHIDDITQGLSELFESSFPVFLEAQEKAQSIDYNNMLTAATFFSAVTATTLQLSYAYNTNPHASFGVAVNTLWFVALVFSTASSLNSLVGLTWYRKIRRKHVLPGWVKLWIEYGPTISLAIASAAFSAGLCLFAFSSSQHTITSTLTAAFTAAHAVALFAPLCLYSPSRISRFLLEVFPTSFNYCKKVCFLRKESPQDRAQVVEVIHHLGDPWSEVDNICNQHDIEQTDTLSTRVKRNIKKPWTSALSSARSVIAWLISRRPNWPALRRRRTHDTRESSNMEQTPELDAKMVTPSELESGTESQEHAGELGMQKYIAPPEAPRASISDVTDSDNGAAPASKGLGKEVGRSPNTRPAPEQAEEHTATTSSAADPIPYLRSIPMVQNSEIGLENIVRQETDISKRLNQPQKDEPRTPSDSSVQEGAEEYNTGASNPTSEIKRGEGIIGEVRPSADVRSPYNLQ